MITIAKRREFNIDFTKKRFFSVLFFFYQFSSEDDLAHYLNFLFVYSYFKHSTSFFFDNINDNL